MTITQQSAQTMLDDFDDAMSEDDMLVRSEWLDQNQVFIRDAIQHFAQPPGDQCDHLWTAGKRIGQDIFSAVCSKCGWIGSDISKACKNPYSNSILAEIEQPPSEGVNDMEAKVRNITRMVDAAIEAYLVKAGADPLKHQLSIKHEADGRISYAIEDLSYREPSPASPPDAVQNRYWDAVQDVDLMTGGDGIYLYSADRDKHCPDPAAMKERIRRRFDALRTLPARQDGFHAKYIQSNAEYFISVSSLEEALSVRQVTRLSDEEVLQANDISREIATMVGGQALITLASAGMHLRDHLRLRSKDSPPAAAMDGDPT